MDILSIRQISKISIRVDLLPSCRICTVTLLVLIVAERHIA